MTNNTDETTVLENPCAELPAPVPCADYIKDIDSWVSMAIALGLDTEAE
jgi:hypothetical protein